MAVQPEIYKTEKFEAALDNISATEWRPYISHLIGKSSIAALDNISATEWRQLYAPGNKFANLLHSIISVLPNGGPRERLPLIPTDTAALDNISATEWRCRYATTAGACCQAALDNISATEWRRDAPECRHKSVKAALDNISATEWRWLGSGIAQDLRGCCTR